MKLNASGTALLYSTYLGGADDDVSNKIVVDAAGNAIIAGWTASLSFPTTAGAISRVCGYATGGSCLDAFVAKLDPFGSALVYSTYLGGSGDDQARGLAVDAGGNAYITGTTASTISRLRPVRSQRIQPPEDLSRSLLPPAPLFTRHIWERDQEPRNLMALPSIPREIRLSPAQRHPQRLRERMFSSQN